MFQYGPGFRTTRVEFGMLWSGMAVVVLSIVVVSTASAEPVAPGVHWGAIAYPDQERALHMGMTTNRFTEFGPGGKRFNAVDESAGFNFATINWTERLSAFPGWSTNLTLGAGPTDPEPASSLQNNFVHRLLGDDEIPADRERMETDFMVGGSLTRWAKLFGEREVGFVSAGFASGSLYHEVSGRIGLRRVSLSDMLDPVMGKNGALRGFSRFVRFSAMGRYGRVFGGEAYHDAVLARHSYLAQGSVSLADYDGFDSEPPRWELEFAVTIDSGLFVTSSGRSIERNFGSIALRFPYGVVEVWNDVLGDTDSGPTFGFQIMFDVRRLYGLLAAP